MNVYVANPFKHVQSVLHAQYSSMMDSYNLGWKLDAVIKGIADRSILDTCLFQNYFPISPIEFHLFFTDRSERVEVAQQLIDFDRKFSGLFSGKPAVAQQAGISVEEFRNLWLKSGKWTTGTAVQYAPSLLVAITTPEKQRLAANVHIGSASIRTSEYGLKSTLTIEIAAF
jgi:phenol 2-monooxygenase (NADPH)